MTAKLYLKKIQGGKQGHTHHMLQDENCSSQRCSFFLQSDTQRNQNLADLEEKPKPCFTYITKDSGQQLKI